MDETTEITLEEFRPEILAYEDRTGRHEIDLEDGPPEIVGRRVPADWWRLRGVQSASRFRWDWSGEELVFGPNGIPIDKLWSYRSY